MFYHLSYRSARRERLDLLSIMWEEGRDSIGLIDPSSVAAGLGTEGRSRIDGGEESDRSIVRAAGLGMEERSQSQQLAAHSHSNASDRRRQAAGMETRRKWRVRQRKS